jgi:competence protein ComEC
VRDRDRHPDHDSDPAARPVPLRPWLPWLAMGLVVGALAPGALANAAGLGWSPLVAWWAVGLPLGLVALAIGGMWPWAGRWLLFAAACLLGGALGAVAVRPPPGEEQRLLEVEGMVTSVKWQGRSQGFALQATRTLAPAGYPPPARLFVRAGPLPGAVCGDQVRVAGVWARDARGEALKAVELERLGCREDGSRGWAWRALDRVGTHRELAEALIIGFGDPPEKPLFRRSGLLHILAVSGTHLAIAAAFGAWLLRVCGVGWTWRQCALGALIAGYTWLTGASAATERALVMGLAVVATGMLAREPHRLAAVSLAALALALLDPANATDIGFQLSLAAVLGIVTLGLDLVRLRQAWVGLRPWPLDRPTWRVLLFAASGALDGLAIGVAATLATMPLIAWYFSTMNPWSPLTTLLATPPTTVALWLGLPCLALGGFAPDGPWEGVYTGIEWSLSGLVQAVALGAALPGAQVTVGAPSPWTLVAWPLLFLPLRDGADLALRTLAATVLITVW